MNYSKLFLMVALGVSLNNVACGMERDESRSSNRLRSEGASTSLAIASGASADKLLRTTITEQNKKTKTEYDAKATQGLQRLLDDGFSVAKIEKIKELLNGNANPNIQGRHGRTPLHWAANNNNKEIVTLLLEFGADPNIKNNSGQTPLHWAADIKNKQIDTLLLEFGKELLNRNLNRNADPNIKDDDGWAPLHWPADKNNKEIVTLLLEAGADPNIKNNSGRTPLHWAADNKNKEIVTLLLEVGADQNIKDDDGRTPLHWAANNKNKEIVTLLLNHMKELVALKNRDQKLEYLCERDSKFKTQALNFLFYLKRIQTRAGLKIQKYILWEMLLRSWELEHENDYRCKIWFDNDQQFLNDWVNATDNKGKTACDWGNEEIKKLIEEFKRETGIN